jgi:hypothetical protein
MDHPFSTPRHPIRRTAVPEAFSDTTIRVLLPQPLSGHGILKTMAVKRNRINIEGTPSTGPETDRQDPARKDAAVMSLARLIGRLIGRQIAREQFDCKLAAERKTQRHLRS